MRSAMSTMRCASTTTSTSWRRTGHSASATPATSATVPASRRPQTAGVSQPGVNATAMTGAKPACWSVRTTDQGGARIGRLGQVEGLAGEHRPPADALGQPGDERRARDVDCTGCGPTAKPTRLSGRCRG